MFGLLHRRLIALPLLAGLAVALVAGTASADLGDLERRYGLLRAHRGRLEAQLTEQGRRIRRLKKQRGVGRDLQLKSALRSSQQLAERLTALQKRLHGLGQRLLRAYDQALQGAVGERRARLLKQRARVALDHRPRAAAKIVTRTVARPDDSAEDLEEKADLLADSEVKVRRQLRRVERRLASLQHRTRLRRHRRSAEDSPFVESAPRRTARTTRVGSTAVADSKSQAPSGTGGTARTSDVNSPSNSVSGPPAPPAQPNSAGESTPGQSGTPQRDDGAFNYGGGGSADPAAPAPVPSGGGTTSSGGGVSPADPGGAGSLSVTVRDVLDPWLLRRLERNATGGTLKARIAALRAARAKLRRLASGLSRQSKSLRDRARHLK